MNNLILVLNIISFVFSQKMMGPFYVVNEGFFPSTYDNDFVTYKTWLRTMKDDYEDKRINGWFHIKHPIKNIGYSFQSWTESNKNWLKRGRPMDFPNLCSFAFGLENFMDRFTGKLNPDPCSIDAGNYTLTDYTFEDDLKKSIGNSMFFGHSKYEITLTGNIGEDSGEQGTVQFDVIIWIKDLDHKHVKDKNGDNKNADEKTHGKKSKKNKRN